MDPEGGLVSWNAVCVGQQASKVMKTLADTFGKPLATTEENVQTPWSSSPGPGPAATASAMTVEETLPRLSAALRKHYPLPSTSTSTPPDLPSLPSSSSSSKHSLNPDPSPSSNPCDSDNIFSGDVEGEEGWDLEIHTLLLSQGLGSE